MQELSKVPRYLVCFFTISTILILITWCIVKLFEPSTCYPFAKVDHICDREHYIIELKDKFRNHTFERLDKNDGMYITNDVNINTSNDLRIFKETQVKRTFRSWFSPFVGKHIKSKLLYFSQEEDKDENIIYQRDAVQDLQSTENYVIQNIGHSTQLIQIQEFNILTDPVFNGLFPLVYPEKTNSYPDIINLPKIDVILISHNHRDHVDESSLQKIQQHHSEEKWPLPKLFVPMGDKKLFEDFGFDEIEEVEWFTKISITKERSEKKKTVHFISIPSDHRSGGLADHHKSLVTGWIINPEHENVIFKFVGDTRSLTDINQQATDCALWNEIKHKQINQGKSDQDAQIPRIICFEPSGPNYSRRDMDVTHQSTSYSVLLKFIEAQYLSKLSGKSEVEFLDKIKTVMIHHNKFELGPDRFNEGLFVCKKLLIYLDMKKEELEKELVRQKNKLNGNMDRKKLTESLPLTSRSLISTLPDETSLLVRAKDFIIEEIKLITSKLRSIDRQQIKNCIVNNTVFPKIGERFNEEKLGRSKFDVESVNKYPKKPFLNENDKKWL